MGLTEGPKESSSLSTGTFLASGHATIFAFTSATVSSAPISTSKGSPITFDPTAVPPWFTTTLTRIARRWA